MENKFPKNVRQIGNVSDTPKIYVEDYVDTFLNQICDKADKEQAGAFLVGKKEVTEGQECLYIFGAICMEFSDDENICIGTKRFQDHSQVSGCNSQKCTDPIEQFRGNVGDIQIKRD